MAVTHIKTVETILYVKDQDRSASFYQAVFRKPPDLHVPGMTEFLLADNCKLGIMPNDGIAGILAGHLPHPSTGSGIPRCELYFVVEDVPYEYEEAVKAGAVPVSPVADRDWGDTVGYVADPDGHVIAFAAKTGR